MDYVEGYSLDRPLRDGMVFPQPDVIRIAVEVLSALHYLHTFPRGDGRVSVPPPEPSDIVVYW